MRWIWNIGGLILSAALVWLPEAQADLLSQLKALRPKVVYKDQVVAHFVGPDGYALYAERHHRGNMREAFDHVQSTLPPKLFRQLHWPARFEGNILQFRFLRRILYGADERLDLASFGNPRWGPTYFALEYYSRAGLPRQLDVRAILRLRKLVTTVVSDFELSALSWILSDVVYHSPTEDEIRTLIPYLNYFHGHQGYLDFAVLFQPPSRDLMFVHEDVKAALPDEIFASLAWPILRGTRQRAQEQKRKLFKSQNVRRKWAGREGHIEFTGSSSDETLKETYKNVQEILGPSRFARLGWSMTDQPPRSISDVIRDRVLRESQPADHYRDQQGYMNYADEWTSGNMHRAHYEVSKALTPEEWIALGWGNQFPTSTTACRELRRLLFSDDRPKPFYREMEGYIRLADETYDGSMLRAYTNAVGALSRDEFSLLGWRVAYQGTTTEYALARHILTSGTDRVDVLRWGGLNRLPLVAQTFADHQIGRRIEMTEASRKKIHRLLFGSLTSSEKKELGWDVPNPKRKRIAELTCRQAFQR